MKVKVICLRDNETKYIDLPMDEKELLEIQGSVLDRDSEGYILGAEVKYYDENDNEIDNIFKVNKSLK